jgi:hypothetical protein
MTSLRSCALAMGVHLTLGAAVGLAQTVIVQNGPPGSQVDVLFNANSIGSATVDSNGDARVTADLFAKRADAEATVQIFLDLCDGMRRILIVESGSPSPSSAACARHPVSGLFDLRPVTTFVVDIADSEPTVRIRQGPAPAEWLRRGPAPVRVRRQAPTGLVVFGGGPGLQFSNIVASSCGNAPTCSGSGSSATYAVGADLWLTPMISMEAGYLRPAVLSLSGSGDTFHFSSKMDAQIATLAGKVAVPLGIVRLYGLAGGNYHRAVSTTTNTIDDAVLTINNATQTLPGATQDFVLEIRGFGWLFGGGGEVWIRPRLALYAEVGRTRLKGTNISGDEGTIDDYGTFELVGARFRIWSK